jgi:hypothetical protein
LFSLAYATPSAAALRANSADVRGGMAVVGASTPLAADAAPRRTQVWAFDGYINVPDGAQRAEAGSAVIASWRLTTAGRALAPGDRLVWLPASTYTAARQGARAALQAQILAARGAAAGSPAADAAYGQQLSVAETRLLKDAHVFATVTAGDAVGPTVALVDTQGVGEPEGGAGGGPARLTAREQAARAHADARAAALAARKKRRMVWARGAGDEASAIAVAGEVSGRASLAAPDEAGAYVLALCIEQEAPAGDAGPGRWAVLFATRELRVTAPRPAPQALARRAAAPSAAAAAAQAPAGAGAGAIADPFAVDIGVDLYDERGVPTPAGLATSGPLHAQLVEACVAVYTRMYAQRGVPPGMVEGALASVRSGLASAPVIGLRSVIESLREQLGEG